jgi:hypothetical protein
MRRYLPLLVILVGLSCCGYSARALLPPHLKTIAVLPVENQTLKPGLDVLLTDSLIDAFRRDGNLRVVDLEKADVVLHCQLTGYDKTAQAYSSSQQVNTWRLSLGGKADAEDKIRSEKLWEGSVSADINYDPNSQTEEAGIGLAISKLTADIVRRTLIAW